MKISSQLTNCTSISPNRPRETHVLNAATLLGRTGRTGELPATGGGEVLIGRKGDADVVLNNQHVSRHHAKLVKTADGYFLQDLGSTHGTFVNETRVERHTLRHGDKISLGKDRIDLHYIIGEAKPSKPGH